MTSSVTCVKCGRGVRGQARKRALYFGEPAVCSRCEKRGEKVCGTRSPCGKVCDRAPGHAGACGGGEPRRFWVGPAASAALAKSQTARRDEGRCVACGSPLVDGDCANRWTGGDGSRVPPRGMHAGAVL